MGEFGHIDYLELRCSSEVHVYDSMVAVNYGISAKVCYKGIHRRVDILRGNLRVEVTPELCTYCTSPVMTVRRVFVYPMVLNDYF